MITICDVTKLRPPYLEASVTSQGCRGLVGSLAKSKGGQCMSHSSYGFTKFQEIVPKLQQKLSRGKTVRAS